MNILLTGGAGYIGTHIAVELLNSDHSVVVADNLSNSSKEAIRRVEEITGKSIPFYEIDACDTQALSSMFKKESFDGVIHLAGYKAVGESVQKPLDYYRNNIDSTLAVLSVMQQHGVKRFVFSSTATVYGTPTELPLTEESPAGLKIDHPYGRTKFMIEQIIQDFAISWPEFEATILRYFNPIGAHSSGTIGEDPKGIPNNLLPYVSQVAIGKFDHVNVFGNDYDTPDGTCLRDYIHVVDLAEGHIAALNHSKPGVEIYNLCTGKGTSVLELIHAFSMASEKEIKYEFSARRPGDVTAYYSSPQKANQLLGWFTKKTIGDACADSWTWQSKNPNGYKV